MSRKTRNLIWSVPLVATLAIVGALALFITLAPNDASAQQGEEAPGMPTELMLRALDQTTIELTWKAPSNEAGGVPDGYRIDYSADGLVWYSLAPNQSALKYVDNRELEASETRHYRIFAYNTGGTSRMLGPVEGMTEASVKPDAPTALTTSLGTVTQEQIVVAWTPPVDPPGAPVTSYRIQSSASRSSGFSDLKTVAAKDLTCDGGRCSYTDTGLNESTERWYRVYSTNSVGESPASEVRSGETAAGDIPAEPTNLRVGISTGGELRLYWDRPDTPAVTGAVHNPPGAPIKGYYIVGGPVAVTDSATDNDTVLFQNTTGDALAAVDINAFTNGPEDDDLPGLGEVVTHAQGTERALNRTGELRTLAKFVGQAGTFDPDTGPDDVDVDDTEGNETEDDIETHWGFRVMAVNRVVERKVRNGNMIEATDGEWSDFIRVNNAGRQTGVLPRPTVEADRHTATNDGRTGIELEWKVTGAAADGTTNYRVEYSEDKVDWNPLMGEGVTEVPVETFTTIDAGTVQTTVNASHNSGVHRGIVAGSGYHYRVFAVQPDPVGSGIILTHASAPATEITATPDRPDTPDLTEPTPQSETELRMTVLVAEDDTPTIADTPANMPGAESGDQDVGFGVLVGYRIEISDDGRDWTKYDPVMIGPELDVRYSYSETDQELTETEITANEVVNFAYTGLDQETTRYFRASTVNNAPGSLKYSEPTEAMDGTTNEAIVADDPGILVAKADGRNAIELVWYARGDHITAAPITGYQD